MHCNLVAIDQQKYHSSQPADPAGMRTNSRIKSERLKQTITYTLIRDWNSLPLNVVEAQSINSFRAQLDMF